MPTLLELAQVLRSKNAGPFQITVDIILPDALTYARVERSGAVTPERVAALYGLDMKAVHVVHSPNAHAVKVTFDRPGPSSGAPGDLDVYGAQQHIPLLDLEIP